MRRLRSHLNTQKESKGEPSQLERSRSKPEEEDSGVKLGRGDGGGVANRGVEKCCTHAVCVTSAMVGCCGGRSAGGGTNDVDWSPTVR